MSILILLAIGVFLPLFPLSMVFTAFFELTLACFGSASNAVTANSGGGIVTDAV